jgi:DNA-binding transcriptional LysR family regulator
MTRLPDLEAWAIFARVAELGSFNQAASELGLARTTVSKAVSRLEERMQASLLHRTTRKLSLTESGRVALDRAARILADGRGIEADIVDQAAVPRGVIRMAATSGFGNAALAPAIPDFLKAYPDVEIDLHLTEDRVDVVGDGFDLILQIGMAVDSSLRSSRLFSVRRPVVASPEFVRRHGMPAHPSDLAHMPAIISSHIPGPHDWEFTRNGHEPVLVHVRGPYRVDSPAAQVPALLGGIGFTALPHYYIARDIEQGRLIELLPEWSAVPGGIYVITPPGRGRPARVRVLIEFLRERFATSAWAIGILR